MSIDSMLIHGDSLHETVEEYTKENDAVTESTIEETTICEVCGVDYNGTTYEEHEAKPFHQGYI